MSEAAAKPATKRVRLWPLWIGLSVFSVAVGSGVRAMAPGWMLVVLGLGLCGLMLAHPIVHTVGALRGGQRGRSMPIVLLLSDLFFVLGFGLQTDFGDAPGVYTGFSNLAERMRGGSGDAMVSDAAGNVYMALAIGFLVALLVSWAVILFLALKKPKEG